MEMGMSKFVKLTAADDGTAMIFNVEGITFAYRATEEATHLVLRGHQESNVTETPEQILALIEGPSGDYEPF